MIASVFVLVAGCVGGPDPAETDPSADTTESPQETCEPAWQAGPDDVSLGVASGLDWCWDVDRNRAALRRVADPTQVIDLHDSETCTNLGGCSTNAECASGVCANDRTIGCACVAACQSDADCGPDSFCAPEFPGPNFDGVILTRPGARCVPATCRTGTDCGSGVCRTSTSGCGFLVRAVCAGPDDTCAFDSDCDDASTCRFDDRVGAFACMENPATCGE